MVQISCVVAIVENELVDIVSSMVVDELARQVAKVILPQADRVDV